MVEFEALIGYENTLLTIVGFGLLLILSFFLLSLLQIVRYLQHISQIEPIPLVLLIGLVLSLLFVFSDISLLSDIHKQYLNQLSQPEWLLVYPIVVFQFLTTISVIYFHLNGKFMKTSTELVKKDINIFLIVQYVGLICGSMGLAAGFLGFMFPKGWSLSIHSVLTSIIFLSPYTLSVIYWGMTKLREKNWEWYDEKQQRDVGRSAFLTIIVISILMLVLFVTNYQNLDGVISFLWLPLYLFGTIFSFSLGNLVFSSRA